MKKATQRTMFSSDKSDWETPRILFNELNRQYHFTLDAAASHTNHKVDRYFTADDDGLVQDWGGETVFCNPHMEIRKPVFGQKSVLRKRRNLAQSWFF